MQEDAQIEVRTPQAQLTVAKNKDNQATRDFLATIDVGNNNTSLVEAWDRATAFEDSNEIVKQNILKNQVLLEDAYKTILKDKSSYEKRLEVLRNGMKDNPEQAIEYLNFIRENQEKTNGDRQFLLQLQNANVAMAREYRQCALNNQWFIHVTKMQKFFLLLQAMLQNRVHDPELKKEISNDLRNIGDECFPAKSIEVESRIITKDEKTG